MDKEQAIHNFWNSFGVKAYDETSVPSDADFPRLTYEIAISDFNNEVALSASLWYYDTSWLSITEKSKEISEKIGLGGVSVPYDGGILWIKKSNPFLQRVADDNDSIRRILINISIDFL